jgi:hypothetical protein
MIGKTSDKKMSFAYDEYLIILRNRSKYENKLQDT